VLNPLFVHSTYLSVVVCKYLPECCCL